MQPCDLRLLRQHTGWGLARLLTALPPPPAPPSRSVGLHRLGCWAVAAAPSMPADLLLTLARCLPAFEWPTSSWPPQLLERVAALAWRLALDGQLDLTPAGAVVAACVRSAGRLRPRFGQELGARVGRMQGELGARVGRMQGELLALELGAEASARATGAAALNSIAAFSLADDDEPAGGEAPELALGADKEAAVVP